LCDDIQKQIVAFGICVGMMNLHHHRIIHRGLKPQDVLMNASLEPKAADFGLSKIVDIGMTMNQSMYRGINKQWRQSSGK
jgi:serine/threonine protein kinase